MQQSNTNQSNKQTTKQSIYQALVIDDEGRVCRDIPDSACNDQPKHFYTHVVSLTASKLADGFVDPKLILSWLLTQLGAASGVIGLLVPIREAGALLPQLFTAQWIRTRQQRKWVWAMGSLVQGLSALAMVLAVIVLTAEQAAIAIVSLLVLLSVARSFCSVSYKDVLGKTLSKSTRGTATGLASTIAAAGVIVFAIMLSTHWLELTVDNLLVLIGIAGSFWILAALSFLRLNEQSGSTEGGENASSNLIERIRSAFSDKQFTLFVIVRGLLMATALAPPFIIMLGQQFQTDSSQASLIEKSFAASAGQLGLLLLASALAAVSSSFFWGRLADKSSRWVLILSACLSSVALLTLTGLALIDYHLLTWFLTLPLVLFVLMIAYHGVRLGRSIHLVDMATPQTRANYTAVSNSVIGVLLLLGSGFGLLAQLTSVIVVIALFAIMCLAAAILAVKLEEQQLEHSVK